MLAEEREVVREALEWRKVKGLFHHDARYRAIDSSSQKEELFKEFIKSLGRVSMGCVGWRTTGYMCYYVVLG